MVINQLEALEISCATLDSCPSDLSGRDIFDTLMRNFNRHYSTNRAPFGIHLQAAWFENSDYFTAFQVVNHVLSSLKATDKSVGVFRSGAYQAGRLVRDQFTGDRVDATSNPVKETVEI